MQHVPSTIEEQLLLKSIKEECPWENLPKRLQVTLSSKEEWHKRVIDHCIKKRLQWNACFARKVCKEGEYYEEMMRYLRKNLALFPYHLAEYICRVMRVSPFRYYCDMIFEVMRNEQPYDSIPNFSAADALRLTGIGRNEFIDIMNKCRSKKIMWKLNKSIAKELLPTQPVDFPIEPWWGVCVVNFTVEEFKKLTEEEMSTIDKVCKEEANSFVLFDPDIVQGLYRRGLIYFDVPVYPDDRFKVSRLEGFVSNREQSYEDPIEELLYAVFVVSSENATVAELATTLQADLSQLQAAASFACRLGWAIKLIDPASILQDSSITESSNIILSDEEDGSRGSISSEKMSIDGISVQQDVSGVENYGPVSGHARVAFVVDANITSYLMMGSVSPGLKSHAVTLYEAGKLGDASIAELCKDLTTLEGTKFEGELQEFANHAFSLRCVLECLQSGGVSTDPVVEEVSAKLGIEYSSNDEAISLIADIDITEESNNSDGNETRADGDDNLQGLIHSTLREADATVESVSESTGDESVSVILSENKSGLDEDGETKPIFQTDGISVLSDSLESGKEILKRKRKYRVDILRCESLASLAPATLDRLFLRDYDIVVSMVPLPSSSVLPGPTGPMHFGPPSYSSMTPWMKLALYSAVGGGPLSVILMKGQCLRLLPAPLSGCEKALIWSWDGSTIGGLGGKFEGNLVKGNILLHCLNSLLKYSAVLVQPLSKYDLDENGRIITLDIPLPLKNADGSVAHIGKEMGLSSEESLKLNTLVTDLSNKMELWMLGYIRLLKLYKERESDQFSSNDEKYEWVPLSVEFGIPLFSPKLCSNICKRVVSSQLLQTDSLAEHHNAMQSLRRRLRDICMEYQATGPTAKLLYQRQQSRESSRKLVTYASGRWNPLVDPSSPISGASSEHQRLKLASRQRCRTEVLSFDGSILRSYALTPVYEAATRPIEDSLPLSTVKVEPDDVDSRQVVLPGVNLLFDGSELLPFDIGACLQARQPVSLIAEASAASASVQMNRVS
ncbi:protein FAM91A1-like [Macadamia integrifolia]|uniref:protein FAM91A1-like n=1 Tax=Macadamia integrifolia TaxID=60698 RepID=UPI001C4F1920|nr:protein FAM91A1-like [Macadamia integrifolia]XP_042493364.1 protein FAM91A1-like [Macadamia integrifolia]